MIMKDNLVESYQNLAFSIFRDNDQDQKATNPFQKMIFLSEHCNYFYCHYLLQEIKFRDNANFNLFHLHDQRIF